MQVNRTRSGCNPEKKLRSAKYDSRKQRSVHLGESLLTDMKRGSATERVLKRELVLSPPTPQLKTQFLSVIPERKQKHKRASKCTGDKKCPDLL